MTTITLHGHVQRHRFFHHALGWLGRIATAPGARAGRVSPGEEAQRVRRLARTYLHSDPGFAADLYAAAARHEDISRD